MSSDSRAHGIPWQPVLAESLGTALLVFSFLAKRIEVAKLYYFESDRRRFFAPACSR
jgi:hypothetical protein